MHVYVTVNLGGFEDNLMVSLLSLCHVVPNPTQTLRLGSTHQSFLPDSPTPLTFEACNGIKFVVFRYFSQERKVSCRLSSDFPHRKSKGSSGEHYGSMAANTFECDDKNSQWYRASVKAAPLFSTYHVFIPCGIARANLTGLLGQVRKCMWHSMPMQGEHWNTVCYTTVST